MAVYYGVVKGNVVVLPDEAEFAEGSLVEVRGPLPGLEQAPEEVRRALYRQYLLETGRVTEIREPGSRSPNVDRRPIQVTGKPLSETLIEERR